MSVRLRKRKYPGGGVLETWLVDVKFEHPDGRVERIRKASPVNTRRGAEQYERQLRLALLDGSYGKEKRQIPTVGQFVESFLTYSESNNKFSTYISKESMLDQHLLPAFAKCQLDAIGPMELENYKSKKLKQGLLPKTVNNHLTCLRKLLALAVDYRLIDHVPSFRWLKCPPVEFEFLAFDEVKRFLDAADLQWRPMLLIAIRTGLRQGELLALKWEDVDLTVGRLIVRRAVWRGHEGTPKGGKTREIPLSESVVQAFHALRHLRGPYVFCQEDGTRLTDGNIKRVPVSASARGGLAKRIGWHDLRHTFASHLVMRGVPLRAVQELLGHATIEMTMRYAHLSPDVKRHAVTLLDEEAPAGQGHPRGTGWVGAVQASGILQ